MSSENILVIILFILKTCMKLTNYPPTIMWRRKKLSILFEAYALLYLILFNPLDCSPPGSSAGENIQARILETAAISYSREFSWPRDWTCLLCLLHWQSDSLPLVPPENPLDCLTLRQCKWPMDDNPFPQKVLEIMLSKYKKLR